MRETVEETMRVLVLALAILATIIDGSHAATKLRVGKALATAATMVPLVIAAKEGFFAKEGVDVEVIDFDGGVRMHQAMAAGSLDMGVGAGTDLAFIAKGSPELAVCNGAGPLLFIGMLVPNWSTAKSLDDLKGARIAVTGTTSLTAWLARDLARQKGWGPNGVTLIAVGGSTAGIAAALRTHLADAAIGTTAMGFQMEADGEGRILAPVSSWAGNLGGSTLFASRALIASDPDAIRRFIRGWFDAVRFMRDPKNRDAAVKIAAEMTGFPIAIQAKEFALTLPMFNTNGRFDAETLANLKQSFLDLKLVDKPPDMSKLYTEEFLPKS